MNRNNHLGECRAIVHLDADAFFASVEQAADPRLRGRPVAVGGEKRGVIASASYEARRFGVATPMPTVQARRLCPQLIVLPGDFEKYERFSRWMFSYAQDFTPDVEIDSIDEGYFDLTGAHQSPVAIAETIRHAIRQALKISVSEGLGANKLVSQIAAKFYKPAAFWQVPAGAEFVFLEPLANYWLPGVGPVTARRLDAAGLAHIGQIAATPLEFLTTLLGNAARSMKEFANGIDDRPVRSMPAAAQSYGQQETFAADTTDEDFVEATLRRMADELMIRVRADGKSIRTVTVKARYNDMAEDQRGTSFTEPTDLETDVYPKLRPLLRQAWQRRVSLRLVALKLSGVYHGFRPAELPLAPPSQQYEVRQHLARVIDALRETHGRYVILRGHDLRLRAKPETQHPKPETNSKSHNADSAEPPSIPVIPSLRGISAPTVAVGARKLPMTFGVPPPSPAPERRGARLSPAAGERPVLLRAGTGEGAGSVMAFNQIAPPGAYAALGMTGIQNCSAKSNAQANPRFALSTWPNIPLRVRSHYSFLDSTLSIPAIIELAQRYELPAVALTDQGNLHGAVEFVEAAKAAGLRPILGAEIGGRLFFVTNAAGYRHLCRILTEGLRADSDTDGLISENAADWPAVHYATPADRWKYDIVQSIRTRTLLRQEHPEKKSGGQFHFPRPGENTDTARNRRAREIAERCQFDFVLGQLQFPAFTPPDGSTPRAFLRTLVLEGMHRRYPLAIGNPQAQIEEELAIIHEVGYEEYFLIVWDILQECRRRGIDWITRGSAADSLVCYCLGISDVCPIRFDLYFRRFLNKERMKLRKLPDIDIDFPHDRKDDVVDLIFAKYGRDQVAVVGGFSTYQGRSALADICKVLGVSEYQARRFTERLPHVAARDLQEAVAQSLECRDLPLAEEPYATALQMAAFLDGFPRYPKMHPCGVVLSRVPMLDLTPCFLSAKGYPTTQFDMDSVEAIGLVKIDILAQGGLAVLRDARALVGQVLETDSRQVSSLSIPPPVCSRASGLCEGLQTPHPARPKVSHPTPDGETSRSRGPARSGDRRRTGADVGAATLDPVPVFPDGLHWLEPWDDPEVWDMIAGGGARAVHHIESPAMISLCRMCHVREIDGLIAIVSVIRPGAANGAKKITFTRRYQGREPVVHLHPSLEPCLKSTFGMVVYEEQILQICEAFAGLPPDRADVLRRALVKENWPAVEPIGREFAACARQRGRADAAIAAVWQLVCDFHGYAFCKAHSTAYGVEAYQAAWFKRYHPAEFMAAVLSNGKGFYRPLVYVLECHRLGLPLLPPWINEPGPMFTVCAGQIRVPATRTKGLSARTIACLVAERQQGAFASLADFCRRVAPSREELEALSRVGAFDGFGQSRPAQFWEIQQLVGQASCLSLRVGQATEADSRQASSLSLDLDRQDACLESASSACPTGVPLTEPTRLERLRWESELLGFPVSDHPLALHPEIAWETYCPVAELGRHAGETVTCCGLIIEDRLHHQVTGEPMKFLTIADWTGIIETDMFAATYKTYGLATVRYPVLEITATVEPFENGNGYSLRVHRAGKPRTRPRNGLASP